MSPRSNVVATAVIFAAIFTRTCEAQTLSVCDALDRLSELNGRTVKISGAFSSGDMGDFLSASPACGHRIVRDGWSWISAISARLDQNPKKFAYFQGQFVEFKSLKQAHPSEKITATLTGTLHTMDHFRVDRLLHRPLGFTYCVAEIVYSRMEDWRIVAYEPGELDRLKREAEHPDALRAR